MRWISIISVLVIWVVALSACGDGSVPIPYLDDQRYEVQDDCVTDFSLEEGSCLAVDEDGGARECLKTEDACVGHFYVQKRRGRPHFTYVNARFPCYPDWLIERYSDPDSEWFQHGVYRVVSIELASAVVKDAVHLIQTLYRSDLQSNEMCYYRLEAAIEDLTKGEYELKLWDPEQELILETSFSK